MFKDLLYRCQDTLLLKNGLDFTPCRLQQYVGSCAVVLQMIWADVQKKIKHSHLEYGHVHNALSRHYKGGQMVANVQESTSTNINLDVIECTKQSADTPAWVYNACTCVGCVVHSIDSAPQLVCQPSVSGSCSGFLTGPTEVVDEGYQHPLQCF